MSDCYKGLTLAITVSQTMHPIVTGPRLQTNVAPRRDIVDLIQDRLQFSLYIQALR